MATPRAAARALPAVHRLAGDPLLGRYAASLGASAVKRAIEDELAAARTLALREERVPAYDAVRDAIARRLSARESEGLAAVLNGTGIVLHTNLGRAPLAPQALAAIAEIAGGYSNLEFDLASGSRGSRYERVTDLLRETTGAPDALVVNNCAAAMLLILESLAHGREVVVARNQIIEIGGAFRLPDVLSRSGARLVEVGTTNRVRLADFEAAVTPQTALFLRSHQSNYRIEGFVEDVSAAQLAALGRRVGVPTVEDLGSGALVGLERFGLAHERTVGEAVRDGATLVAFSGDKLLGGPQAGIIAGAGAAIARLRANPLLRALRVDKATLAALAATLRLSLNEETILEIPIFRMLAQPLDALRARAEAISGAVAPGLRPRVVASEAYAGGGTLPATTIPSVALELSPAAPDRFAQRLRCGDPPLVGRTEDRCFLIDLRTIPPERDAEVVAALDRC
ncbi:MAG: L-seryl-tRNA(Sec) selenium transferase [Candidatus Eremiobacteraeota bacterium]|nr:L-seryl-tRNA(Sec) selenium transferase [Candidatus Eremiobacteraeota bacterium]